MPTTLILKPEHQRLIRTHAERTYPEECCGLLLGTLSAAGKMVVEVIPTENAWSESAAESFAAFAQPRTASKHRSFSIAPQVMLAVQKEARERGLAIVGIYHSHPEHPAIPSEFDRAIAWPEYSYLIVSVPQGRAGDCFSWALDDTTHQFSPETLISSLPSHSDEERL